MKVENQRHQQDDQRHQQDDQQVGGISGIRISGISRTISGIINRVTVSASFVGDLVGFLPHGWCRVKRLHQDATINS
jgi:hypothetical protein